MQASRRRCGLTWRPSPTARRSSTSPVRLNTNENPYPPPAGLVRAITAAAAEAAAGLNRYPDRDAVALRADLAAYLGHGLSVGSRCGRPTGPTRSSSSCCRRSAGRAARALGFEPSYSMHPLTRQDTGTSWMPASREADFGLDAGRAAAACHASCSRTWCS